MRRTIFFLPALLLFFVPALASAANLELWSPDASTRAGELVEVRVLVDSDEAFNAVQGRITFPTSRLSVVSITKQNSIVSLWVQEPVYSNIAGTIDFSGGVPNPGYSGPQRRVITITFRAKAEGSAALAFADGSVLANDGQGTELLENARGVVLSVEPGEVAPTPEVPAQIEEVPVQPSEPTVVVPEEPQTTEPFDLRAYLFETSIPLAYFAAYVLASLVAGLWMLLYYAFGFRVHVYRVGVVQKSGRSRKNVED